MSADEFSLIQRYFTDLGESSANRILGVGDDAAIIQVPAGFQLAVCMDTLIEGVHFPHNTAASDIAIKSLVVNLSDLAAMAAQPDWFQLSLTLPKADDGWLDEFARALQQTAQQYRVELVGGDTCRGALSVTIQAAGLVPQNQFLRRDNARPGDMIIVSGQLGDAALGLSVSNETVNLEASLASTCLARLNRPHPRLELIEFLRRHASSAIDISDGLVADLGHILESSDAGAIIYQDRLPVNHWIREHHQYHLALQGGDDYEICCTVAEKYLDEVQRWNHHNPHCPLSVIGVVTEEGYLLDNGAQRQELSFSGGFRHFW